MMKNKNYGFAPILVVLVPIGFLILLFGGFTFVKLIQILNSPIIGGSIPIWVILVVLGAFFMIKK